MLIDASAMETRDEITIESSTASPDENATPKLSSFVSKCILILLQGHGKRNNNKLEKKTRELSGADLKFKGLDFATGLRNC